MLHAREVAMMITMDKLTDKPGWEKMVFDKDVLKEWRGQARAISQEDLFAKVMLGKPTQELPRPKIQRIISEQCFDYVRTQCCKYLNMANRYHPVHQGAPRQGEIL